MTLQWTYYQFLLDPQGFQATPGAWFYIDMGSKAFVVAVGYAEDWACYEGAVWLMPMELKKSGDKIYSKQAAQLFPQLDIERYRD